PQKINLRGRQILEFHHRLGLLAPGLEQLGQALRAHVGGRPASEARPRYLDAHAKGPGHVAAAQDVDGTEGPHNSKSNGAPCLIVLMATERTLTKGQK